MVRANTYYVEIRFKNADVVSAFLIALRELLERAEENATFGDEELGYRARRVREAFEPFTKSLVVDDVRGALKAGS